MLERPLPRAKVPDRGVELAEASEKLAAPWENGRQLKRSNSFGMNNKDRSKSTRTKKQPRIRRPKSELRSFLFRIHIFVPLLIDVPTVKYISNLT